MMGEEKLNYYWFGHFAVFIRMDILTIQLFLFIDLVIFVFILQKNSGPIKHNIVSTN